MKIKFNSSNLEILNNQQIIPNVTITFSFEHELLTQAKKIIKPSEITKLANLTSAGSSLLLNTKPIIIVSLGKKSDFTLQVYFKALKELSHLIKNNENIKKANLVVETQISTLLKISYADYVEKTLLHTINYLYSFDEQKSTPQKLTLTAINVVSTQDINNTLTNVGSLVDGLFLLKHLANNPSNIITPSYMAHITKDFSKLSKKVKVEILNHKEIKKAKMHTFLAVAKGSSEEPKFIKLEYNGATAKTKPVVLVGKGITFDSGGISLKPSDHMDEMKYDMCGAATVIGVFYTTVKLGLPINLVVLVPACENMPSGNAIKPGDVIKTMNGTTVEVLNTDAEGRLILCDALTYAKRYNPECVIDLATLTGACIIALGHITSGLLSNDDTLANKLIIAGTNTDDKVWRLPLFKEYHDMLKSNVADISNISNPKGAGTITAACFLEKFVDYKWAHLDIAGTAWNSNQFNSNGYTGASGRPFYMLMEFLRNLA